MYIDETNRKKYSPDKLVLLGLLVFGLLIAQLLVKARSTIVMGRPIILEAAGLSVSLPRGDGWECDTAWKYHSLNQQGYSVRGYYNTSSQRTFFRPQAQVELRYILNRYKTDSHARIQKRADLVKGVVLKNDSIDLGPVTLEWAHIFDEGQNSNVFFGTAIMSEDYLLDIDVMETVGDSDFGQRIFENIVKTIQFHKLN